MWKKRNLQISFLSITVFFLFTSQVFFIGNVTAESDNEISLVCKFHGSGIITDYFNLASQHLANIGIKLELYNLDWSTFVGELTSFHDYDMIYLSLSGGDSDSDFRGVYDENGSFNVFGYNTNMDYDADLGTGLNEWYLQTGATMVPPTSTERIQHYWAWEQYLMDEILPLLPTFVPRLYEAIWNNLIGYEKVEGILQSWGKMTFDGVHEGQLNTTELVIADSSWENLNPIYSDDSASSFITKAIMDPLVHYDSDLSVWPHLATNWTHINDTHVRVTIREEVKWQPDIDNNFTNEYLDVKDVYFTYYLLTKVFTESEYSLIQEIKIIDDYTIDFYIDSNPATPELDPSSAYLKLFDTLILPEHYLNQTQLADGITPDISHESWTTFATNCFGTGLFTLDTFTPSIETVLAIFPDCWRLNETITNDPRLDWERRFGDFSSGISQLRIRLISNFIDRLSEFENGKLDIVDITSDSETKDAYLSNSNISVQNQTSSSFGFFGFNIRPDREHLGNTSMCSEDSSLTIGLAIRKAICYGINREEINQIVNSGDYVITDYPINYNMGIWKNPEIIRYNYNKSLALEYLFKAGFTPFYGKSYLIENIDAIYFLFIMNIVSLISIKRIKKKYN